MNWKLLAKSGRNAPPRRVRSRPNLDALEDRTVLSPVPFHIVQNQSPLTLSGTIGGVDIQEQGPGALTTTYFGDFQTDIDEANGAINFIGTGNDFCAADTGRWAPMADGSGGTATAIYGFQADVAGPFLGAIRDFHVEIDTFGSALPLYQNDDGSLGFPSAQVMTIHAGSGTYAHPNLGHGPIALGGQSGPNQAADGTLYDGGDGTFTIVIPFSFSVSGAIAGMDYTFNIDGVGVGVSSSGAPQPGGRTRGEATIGTALVSGTHSLTAVAPAALDTSLSQRVVASPRGGVELIGRQPAAVANVGFGGVPTPLAHHDLPGALDPVTALDVVLQQLA